METASSGEPAASRELDGLAPSSRAVAVGRKQLTLRRRECSIMVALLVCTARRWPDVLGTTTAIKVGRWRDRISPRGLWLRRYERWSAARAGAALGTCDGAAVAVRATSHRCARQSRNPSEWARLRRRAGSQRR